jgi:hypothetical protein
MMICGIAFADVLPGPVPENQMFGVTSAIDGIGLTAESTTFVWHIGDQKADEIPIPYGSPFGIGSVKSGSISYSQYRDAITANGGMISEVKSFSLDTNAKTSGFYNINTEKILTYNSQMGSHLVGDERYILDVAGNWTWTPGVSALVCVFSSSRTDSLIPSFCNRVTASSRLTSITTAQVQTLGSIRPSSASRTVPAALNYEISVTPDASSATGYAEGMVATTFTISVREGRTDGNFSPGLVNNMFFPQWFWTGNHYEVDNPYSMHGANGMLLNAGAVSSFDLGDTGRNNDIFIGNSSGYPYDPALGWTNDPYLSGIFTSPDGHCQTDVNIACFDGFSSLAQVVGNPTTSMAQSYWADDVIVVVKDGITILDVTGTMLQNTIAANQGLVNANGAYVIPDQSVITGAAADANTPVNPLPSGTQIVLDGILITKNGGGYDVNGNPVDVSWTVEFTDAFGRIPPGSVYDLSGTKGNIDYVATSIRTGVPYLEHYDELGARLDVIDTEWGAGGITTFMKSFEYISGVACQDC